MAKFTKGKWVNMNDEFTYAPDGERISGGKKVKGVAIAYTCLFYSIDGSDPEEERAANTRLIAAAPEMYDLLHSLLGYAYEAQGIATSTPYKIKVEHDIARVNDLIMRIDGRK